MSQIDDGLEEQLRTHDEFTEQDDADVLTGLVQLAEQVRDMEHPALSSKSAKMMEARLLQAAIGMSSRKKLKKQFNMFGGIQEVGIIEDLIIMIEMIKLLL